MTPATHIAAAIGIGVGATALVDLWNLAIERTLGVPSLSYCFLGRWIGHMPAGTIRHRAIGAAEAKRGECAIGWIAHYTIGVTLAGGFLLVETAQWLVAPTLLPALLYGIATVLLPFFVLQPALGFGIASSATRRPMRARLKSLATHTVFGVGLYVWGQIAAYVAAR